MEGTRIAIGPVLLIRSHPVFGPGPVNDCLWVCSRIGIIHRLDIQIVLSDQSFSICIHRQRLFIIQGASTTCASRTITAIATRNSCTRRSIRNKNAQLGDCKQAIGLVGLGLVIAQDSDANIFRVHGLVEGNALSKSRVSQSAFGDLLIDVRCVLANIDLVGLGPAISLPRASCDRQTADTHRLCASGIVSFEECEINRAGVIGEVDPILVVEGRQVLVEHVRGRVPFVGCRCADQLEGSRVVLECQSRRGIRGGSVATLGSISTQDAGIAPVRVVVTIAIATVSNDQADVFHPSNIARDVPRFASSPDDRSFWNDIGPVGTVSATDDVEGH